MIYAASPALDGSALRRARRGALPPGPLPRAGVGGGDHPPRRPRRSGVPVGHGVERRGVRRLDRDRARPHRGGHRGAPTGELEHLYLVGERGADALHLLPTFIDATASSDPTPTRARLDARATRHAGTRGRPRTRCAPRGGSRSSSASTTRQMLPAIVFVFSRAGCDQAVQQCLAAGLRLTDPARAGAIRAIAEEQTEPSPDADLEVLRYDAGSPASRPASPRTTPGWCRR